MIDNPWPHLDSGIFSIRFGAIAGYLKTKKAGVVVDLNCGKEPTLFKFLPKGTQYVGNDVRCENEVCPDIGKLLGSMTFVNLPDTRMLAFLKSYNLRPDALVLMGIGAGEYTGESVESSTDRLAMQQIVSFFVPETVILESVTRFEDRYSLLSSQLQFFNLLGYEPPKKVFLRIGLEELADVNSFVKDRIMWVFDKR